jgi:hypothetical protein
VGGTRLKGEVDGEGGGAGSRVEQLRRARPVLMARLQQHQHHQQHQQQQRHAPVFQHVDPLAAFREPPPPRVEQALGLSGWDDPADAASDWVLPTGTR